MLNYQNKVKGNMLQVHFLLCYVSERQSHIRVKLHPLHTVRP